MAGGDTITRVPTQVPTLAQQLRDSAWRAVCRRLGHVWADFPGTKGLLYGDREYCTRCKSNRVIFPDGEVVEATRIQLMTADRRFAEALYEVRWGDQPRRRLAPGEWPAP